MEREQFLIAVEQYQNMVYRVALHYYGNPQDAEDTLQEVFLRLYLEENPFEDTEHLRRWLIRVTANHCKDVLKSPWRKKRVSLEGVSYPIFQDSKEHALYHEVMALPEKYRTVLYLFYYEELSTKEIAEVLALRQSAVTTQLSRGRTLLKQRLGETWNDDE